ncbi:MAG TPA: dihydrodipicolinate synthase family protein [Mycobacterium sp.]|nr:dihydrodipicolinate synthase family protein [Mycobacterium sp.]
MNTVARPGGDPRGWAAEHLCNFYMCPLTPMTRDFELDEPGLRHNIDAFIEMGCTGLVVGGFFAEGWNMTLEEWRRYHEVVADATAGRLPLFTIILDSSAYQAVEKLRFVQSLGYVGAEVMNPSVQLKTDDDVVAYFNMIAPATELALVLYRTPVSGYVYSHAAVARIAEHDNVVGVKNGTLSWTDSIALRRAVGDRLVVSEPNERYWVYDVAQFGGRVLYGELSLLLYGKLRDSMREYTRFARDGDLEKALPLSDRLTAARAVYDDVLIGRIAATGSYVAAMPYLKAWFELLGLRAGPMRPPVRATIPHAERDRLAERLDAAGVL